MRVQKEASESDHILAKMVVVSKPLKRNSSCL